jgi:hypothetical protein
MSGKSAAIVGFIANLLPLYLGERHGEHWCARSLQDGTLILPIGSGDEDGDDEGWVNIYWQGDQLRRTEVLGQWIATIAVERYVRLHGVGASEEAIAAELWFMARHFHFKTGCHVYLPELPEPPSQLAKAGRKALEIGQGILTNLVTPRL